VTPFDIVEAESEIVAGYHVEYSGMKFGLFFLAEFANTFLVGALTTVLFLGGWHNPLSFITDPYLSRPLMDWLGAHGGGLGALLTALLWNMSPFVWFTAKTFTLISIFFWIRATLPRVRVDQLMDFGWKLLIPLGLLNLAVVAAFVAFQGPLWVLAVVNWVAFLLLLAIGATKTLPAVRKTERASLVLPVIERTPR
jgi:NADH-quinone oxidoreductase subunit H